MGLRSRVLLLHAATTALPLVAGCRDATLVERVVVERPDRSPETGPPDGGSPEGELRDGACGDGAASDDVCEPQQGSEPDADVAAPDAGNDTGEENDAGPSADAGACIPKPVPTQPVPLVNGSFDDDASGWIPRTRVQLGWVPLGAQAPGALQSVFLANEVGGREREISGTYQCVPAWADTRHRLRVTYQLPSDEGVAARIQVVLHEQPDCSDDGVPSPGPTPPLERGDWVTYEREVDTEPLTADADEGAVQIQLLVAKRRETQASVLWDDVTLDVTFVPPTCGNCMLDLGETCDHGEAIGQGGCSASCQLE